MIYSKIQTTVKGQELIDDFLERIREGKNSYVTVGVHEDAGSYTTGSNPPSVVEVALWNEFGTSTIPERSWLRSTVDENAGKINAWREEMISHILFDGWTVDKALTAIGFRLQVLLQNKIKLGVPPPNAPATVAAKQKHGATPYDKPLMDTQLLLRSITFKVYND